MAKFQPRFATTTCRNRHLHRRRVTNSLAKLVRALEHGEYELVAKKKHSVVAEPSQPAAVAESSSDAIFPLSESSSTSYDEMTSSSDLIGETIPTIVYRYHIDEDEVMSPKYEYTVYCHSPQSARSSTGRTSSTVSESIPKIFDADLVSSFTGSTDNLDRFNPVDVWTCSTESGGSVSNINPVKLDDVPKSITASTFSEPLSPMRWSDYTFRSSSSSSSDLPAASDSSSWESMRVEKRVRFAVASPVVHTSCISVPLDVEYQPIRYTSSTALLITSPTERLDRMRYLEQMCQTLTTELEQNKRELEEHRNVLGEHRQQLDGHSREISEEARLRKALWTAVENQAELVELHERRTINLDELNASLNGLELRMELVEKKIIGGSEKKTHTDA